MQKTSEARVDETSQSTARATAGQDVGEWPAGKAGGDSHSPLPWRYDRNAQDPAGRSYAGVAECIVAANGDHVVCAGHYYDEAGFTDRPDCEFIVRACNSHHPLVEALKAFLESEAWRSVCDYEACGCETSQLFAQAQAALAKAEARSQD